MNFSISSTSIPSFSCCCLVSCPQNMYIFTPYIIYLLKPFSWAIKNETSHSTVDSGPDRLEDKSQTVSKCSFAQCPGIMQLLIIYALGNRRNLFLSSSQSSLERFPSNFSTLIMRLVETFNLKLSHIQRTLIYDANLSRSLWRERVVEGLAGETSEIINYGTSSKAVEFLFAASASPSHRARKMYTKLSIRQIWLNKIFINQEKRPSDELTYGVELNGKIYGTERSN